MALFHDSAIAGASGQAAGGAYKIERSLRFNSSDSAYLSRTLASPTNQDKWTLSFWMKLGFTSSSSIPTIIGADTSSTSSIHFEGSNNLRVAWIAGTPQALELQRVFRDLSAWYHVVVTADTQNSTVSSKLKIYVNGADQEGAYSIDNRSTLGASGLKINSNVSHFLGTNPAVTSRYFSGYLADIHFIDGQALDPSSFAETNITTGQWVPKAYTGTYGTNGFRLAFADNSNNTATTLGKDTSGNGNNWTPNNLSVTAGAGNDSLVDTPTSYGTDTGAGGEVRGNYCTLNPLDKTNQYGSGLGPLSNGNLDMVIPAGIQYTASGNFALSGKTYAEFTGSSSYYGLRGAANSNLFAWIGTDFYRNGTNESVGVSYNTTDIVGIAYDSSNQQVSFYKNGSLSFQKTISSDNYVYFVSGVNTTIVSNFGQRPFAYTAPSGFKALCDTNLPAPVVAKPSTVMDVKLYTGNDSTQTISGLGFSPDLVWIKARSNSFYHRLYDTIRGTTKALYSNTTETEGLYQSSYENLTAFNSDGFSLGSTSLENGINKNGSTFAAWCWDAGSSTVTNTQGSITSQVRANASAGFSIVSFSVPSAGTNFTVGHGLGVTPSLIIVKGRGGADNWVVFHSAVSTTTSLFLRLNTTGSLASLSGIWGTALPNSSVFGGLSDTVLFPDQNAIAYCFAPVAGYSSFGSYTGNGSTDGPFVYTGFRPRWIILKASSIGGGNYSWRIWDAVRDSYNASVRELFPNLSNSESADGPIDILSNGFKLRDTFEGRNQNATTYIYAAFAENPFQFARAR